MEQIISIQSFGARLRSRDGLFVVYLPDLSGAGQHREEEFAASSVDSIMLHPHTSASVDALLLAQKHQIPVLLLDERELPASFLAGLQPPSSFHIWKQQLLLHGTSEGLGYAREWLCLKVRRKIEWLGKLRSYREGPALERINNCLTVLHDTHARLAHHSLVNPGSAAASLRGIEGQGQRVYLDTLSSLLPAQTKFDGRSRRPAEDIFNAMLNYAYGILYNWVERALWETGLNPYIGFLHSGERQHKALLFDLIEPFRPWMDKAVFKLCARKQVNSQQHARQLPEGGFWLNTEGKRIVAETVYQRFNRKMVIVGERTYRLRHAILVEIRQFALLLSQTGTPLLHEETMLA